MNVAHPLINQEKFTKEEDSVILRLAKKFNNYQWEAVARELAVCLNTFFYQFQI